MIYNPTVISSQKKKENSCIASVLPFSLPTATTVPVTGRSTLEQKLDMGDLQGAFKSYKKLHGIITAEPL